MQGATIFAVSMLAVRKTQTNSGQVEKPVDPTPPVEEKPPVVQPEKPEEGKTYETKDGLLFNHKGEITGYKWGEDKSIKIEKLLIDKNNPNIIVVANRIKADAFRNKKVRVVTIPSTIQEIGDNAFNNSGVEGIEFEENTSLRVIGEGAFLDHQIINISIPATVEKLGAYAFKTKYLLTRSNNYL